MIEALNDRKKSLKGSRVLLLGLAYKANVDDMRESPTFVLINLLTAGGAQVAYHDPHMRSSARRGEHQQWTGRKSVKWNRKTISGYDLVLVSTAHADVNYKELAQWAPLIVDTRNAMAKVKAKAGRVWKA